MRLVNWLRLTAAAAWSLSLFCFHILTCQVPVHGSHTVSLVDFPWGKQESFLNPNIGGIRMGNYPSVSDTLYGIHDNDIYIYICTWIGRSPLVPKTHPQTNTLRTSGSLAYS
jgi:hypothetical protein